MMTTMEEKSRSNSIVKWIIIRCKNETAAIITTPYLNEAEEEEQGRKEQILLYL